MRVRRHVARVRLQRQSADTVQCRSACVQIDSVELNQPHAHHMMRQMQQQAGSTELDDGERCDCGLPVEKSTLPRGWSIHLSQDPQTLGEVRPTLVSSYYQALHNANKSGFSFIRQLITRHCSHLCAAHTPAYQPSVRYQKRETNLDFTEARDSERQSHQLGICKSAPRSRRNR